MSNKKLQRMCPLMLTILLTACGGSGGGSDPAGVPEPGGDTSAGTTTTFSGGTLSELQALNPSLTFDHLEITGGLKLPNFSSTVLTVNRLTITPTGSIGYSYGTCDYFTAPDLTINASGDVTIDGEILLGGRSGTNVTSGSTCNSCYGQNGGDIFVNAGGDISAKGRIMNHGGYGASITYVGLPSSSCSAGDSGNLTLAAGGNFAVTGSEIYNKAGKNGSGVYGASGAAHISAGNLFALTSGSIATTGALLFQAGSTDIWGPITYGSLTETIGGATDSTNPSLSVITPLPGSALDWHQPLQIQLQSADSGMGLREVSVIGLGLNQIYPPADFVNGILTIDHPAVELPNTLDVVATDNKGYQTSASVTGLSISYPQESEPNDNMAQAQILESGGIIEGDILSGDAGSSNTAIQSYLGSQGVTCSSALIEDWYAMTLTSSGYLSIGLDFSGNLNPSDIDLYLLDGTGATILASSTNDNIGTGVYTEHVSGGLLSAGTYYLAVKSCDVLHYRAYYTLQRTL